MHRNILFGVAALLMLAGCTGSFEVEQTEPIRVQLEGEGEQTTVERGEEQGFLVVVDDREAVEFEVKVRRASGGLEKVFFEVRDDHTGKLLASDVLMIDRDAADSEVFVQNIVVDVRGKNNVVLLTQADGDADVTVTARQGTLVEDDVTDGADDGMDDGQTDGGDGNTTDGGDGNTTDGGDGNTTIGGETTLGGGLDDNTATGEGETTPTS